RKMEGGGSRDIFRMRVSDYRIIYEIYKNQVLILIVRVGHRKDVYR
ncbi:MAG: hypothetical protein JWQ35_844, partial [Bacteriovoracaceae bacterium]|nr:hypothetical protein [Bacteriovoracaceae bacterium]